MSTFGGKIQEIPNISVDRFDGENFYSEAYFLSHCHTDHMRGLVLRSFQQQLIENGKYLYASQLSCAILKRMYPFIENNIKELDLNIPITISLKQNSISVTLISAGHCPGSVMFLFENDMRILYTGDYRIGKNDIKKFKNFYDPFNKVKIIDKIYLDTTFFLKKYLQFPKREDSLQELIQIIEEWTAKGKFFFVNLITCAKYGYEYVFNKIFDELNMPVHVGEEAFKFYSLIPEMDKAVTINGTKTQIHSSCNSFAKTCFDGQDVSVKRIKVSAFRWTQENLTEGMSEFEFGDHYICYSTHASYEEGVALIRFLKPRQIEICVKHNDPNINKEMRDLIDQHLEEFDTLLSKEKPVPKFFDTESQEKKRKVFNSSPRKDIKIQNNADNQAKSLNFFYNQPKHFQHNKIRGDQLKTDEFSSEISQDIPNCFINSKFGHSSKLPDENTSFNIRGSKIPTTSNNFNPSLELTSQLNSETIKNKDQEDPENILYSILNSNSQSLKNDSENIKSSGNEEDEDAKLLMDIINSRPT